MKIHAILLRKWQCLVLRDYSFTRRIDLVADDHDFSILAFHLIDAMDPITEWLESLFICQVEAEDDAIGLAIELLSNVPELFLPRCVKYLHLNFLVILFIVVFRLYVVHTNRFHVIGNELTLGRPPDQTCFSSGCIAQHNQIYLPLYHLFLSFYS